MSLDNQETCWNTFWSGQEMSCGCSMSFCSGLPKILRAFSTKVLALFIDFTSQGSVVLLSDGLLLPTCVKTLVSEKLEILRKNVRLAVPRWVALSALFVTFPYSGSIEKSAPVSLTRKCWRDEKSVQIDHRHSSQLFQLPQWNVKPMPMLQSKPTWRESWCELCTNKLLLHFIMNQKQNF